LTHDLLWAYSYPGDKPNPKAKNGVKMTPVWSMASPIIAGGKVVFTAPDGDGVHCLNLYDGSLLWQAGRKDDVYLDGVHGDKVLLVGKSTCRALRFKDGKETWRLKTGMPSGQGAAAGGLYYLPLASKEIAAIDTAKGRIVKRFKMPKGEPAL